MLMNVLTCLLRYVAIIIPVVVTLFLVRYLLPVPHEVFRKVLHAVAFTSTPLIMWLVGDWCVTCLTLLLIGLVVWPILAALERVPLYSYFLVERHMHEIRRSMLLFFWGDALLVALCWGSSGIPRRQRHRFSCGASGTRRQPWWERDGAVTIRACRSPIPLRPGRALQQCASCRFSWGWPASWRSAR